jgi:hypothetical protein
MVRTRKKIRTAFLAAWLILLTAACGDSGPVPEQIYLHVFNAYPGTNSMSLYGPSGTVTSNLGFGQRDGPVSVNRNLGTNFEMILSGAPSPFDVNLPLYNLYPHETATVLFKRRTGSDTVDEPVILRHVQTGYTSKDGQCRILMDNGLSVQNDRIGQFNFIPTFKIKPSCTGYVERIGSFRDSGLEINTEAGQKIQVGRPGLYQRVANNPWFIPGDVSSGEVLDVRNVKDGNCPALDSSPQNNTNKQDSYVAGDNSVAFYWAPPATVEYDSGTFRSPAPTRQYMNCIGWDPDKPAGRQKIKSEQVLECQRSEANAEIVSLTGTSVSYYLPTGIGLKKGNEKLGNNKCGFRMSVMSDFYNIFDEKTENDTTVPIRVRSTLEFNPSQYYFWVLYGRPVRPRVEQWGAKDPKAGNGGGGFVKTPPYPGQQ